MNNSLLNNALINDANESLSSLDRHFAGFICDIAKNKEPWLYLAAALVSNAVQKGHVCIDLSAQNIEFPIIINKVLFPSPSEDKVPCLSPAARGELGMSAEGEGNRAETFTEWIRLLKGTSVVGEHGEYKPLILENNRLYLHKYWQFEQYLSQTLLERAKSIDSAGDSSRIVGALSRLFSSLDSQAIDWQGYSALVALIKNMVIISGGPGTGKTTTVAKIIAFLMEIRDISFDHIALAAPTGKAAARLKNAFVKALSALDSSPEIKQNAQNLLGAHTIHRLLGVVPRSPFFKHTAENPLPHEVIVIDEASMVDFALMAKLLSAIKPDAKIILLGDKDQLSSVEAGAFFGDLCEESRSHPHRKEFEDAILTIAPVLTQVRKNGRKGASDPSSLSECVVELTKNYRFPGHSGIGKLSRAIQQGMAADALTILSDKSLLGVSWQNTPPADKLAQALYPVVMESYGGFLKEEDPVKAYGLFDSFRVLCALRGGPFGVLAINSCIERILASSGLIVPNSVWYAGRPVIVTGNDYGLGLFNGDIGITMSDREADGELKVFFPSETAGTLKSLRPQRLPPHETVFAMTVHKSQGSEFDRVLLILPPMFIPLLSRELLYTGVTRAHERCDIWGSREILVKTIENRTKRMSGLREKLWGK